MGWEPSLTLRQAADHGAGRGVGKAHRATGALALVLAAFVAYHCLWALGLEYGHLHNGEKVGARTVVHGVLGCAVFGTVAVKIAAVRCERAPGWFLAGRGRAALHAVRRGRADLGGLVLRQLRVVLGQLLGMLVPTRAGEPP